MAVTSLPPQHAVRYSGSIEDAACTSEEGILSSQSKGLTFGSISAQQYPRAPASSLPTNTVYTQPGSIVVESQSFAMLDNSYPAHSSENPYSDIAFNETYPALSLDMGLEYTMSAEERLGQYTQIYPSELQLPWLDATSSISYTMPMPSQSRIFNQPTQSLTECSTPINTPSQSSPSVAALDLSKEFNTDNQRWHATQSRSRAADAAFLYGVLTTKIFCRPSCASRRPSRRHVQFFPFPGAIEAASQANFRPCKRCIPCSLGANNSGVLGIGKALRLIIVEVFNTPIASHKKGPLALESLAKLAGFSTFHFHRLFKASTQVTPGDFIHACRALDLQDSLRSGHNDATATAKISSSWSPRTARKALGGISPTEYSNGAPLKEMRYACADTPCGNLCVVFSGDELKNSKIHAVISEDAKGPACQHFSAIKGSAEHKDNLRQCLDKLEMESWDRDTELDADVLPVLWRARVWLRLR